MPICTRESVIGSKRAWIFWSIPILRRCPMGVMKSTAMMFLQTSRMERPHKYAKCRSAWRIYRHPISDWRTRTDWSRATRNLNGSWGTSRAWHLVLRWEIWVFVLGWQSLYDSMAAWCPCSQSRCWRDSHCNEKVRRKSTRLKMRVDTLCCFIFPFP